MTQCLWSCPVGFLNVFLHYLPTHSDTFDRSRKRRTPSTLSLFRWDTHESPNIYFSEDKYRQRTVVRKKTKVITYGDRPPVVDCGGEEVTPMTTGT